jgi:hypothetical protein
LLIGVPLAVGMAFGKKAAAVMAVGSVVSAAVVAFLFVGPSYKVIREETVPAGQHADLGNTSEALREGRSLGGADRKAVVDSPIGEPPPDSAVRAYAVLLSDQKILSDRSRPAWADQPPGLDHGVYRWPLKSGLFSTQEECRQALAVAIAQAVAQYGKTYLADASAADLSQLRPDWFRRSVPFGIDSETYQYRDSEHGFSVSGSAQKHTLETARARVRQVPSTKPGASASTPLRPFPEVTASGPTNLIEQPLYAETVESSVGPMQQLHALLEFGDYPRAQLYEAWRQAAIPRRLRWAASGFGAVLAIVGVLLAALRFDLASGGRHRGRLRWVTALMILLVVGSAWGLCLL